MSETESKSTTPQLKDIVVPPKQPRAKAARFTSREQIVARIDKFTAKAARKRNEQRDLYVEIGKLQRVMVNRVDVIGTMAKKETLADKLGRQADRLEKDVLPTLKSKLAEFDTEVLPGVVDDRSIPGV